MGVGRQQQVERCSLNNLGVEQSGGTDDQFHWHAAALGENVRQPLPGPCKIGSHRHHQRLRSLLLGDDDRYQTLGAQQQHDVHHPAEPAREAHLRRNIIRAGHAHGAEPRHLRGQDTQFTQPLIEIARGAVAGRKAYLRPGMQEQG